MSHIVHNLNKLDIGSSERFLLTSHDNENVLVVSYADIQNAVTKCFQELLENR
jgi:PAB-dependent poly(A)-specific ribonuclease subunit 3